MRIDDVVVNASPLISLFRSGQADLLPRLFRRIVVPDAVWNEVVVEDKDDAVARELSGQSWPVRESVNPSPRVNAWNLGAGETAVLSHALAHRPHRAIIDAAAARRCAITLDIPVLGTGGIIVLAKRRGLIPSIGASLEKLRAGGLWLSDELVTALRARAGE